MPHPTNAQPVQVSTKRSLPSAQSSKKYVVTPSNTPDAAIREIVFDAQHNLHFLHRIAIFVFAVGYVVIAFSATFTAVKLLRGNDNAWNEPEDDEMPLIADFLGAAAIRNSPLVQNVLDDSTQPRNFSIFLQEADSTNFFHCQDVDESLQDIRSDAFMRSMYDAIVDGTSYNISGLARTEIELIAPVVDCQSTLMDEDDVTSVKFFYLVRAVNDPELVSVLVVYLTNQQYKSAEANGATAFATVQLIDDMRRSDLDQHAHYVLSLGFPFVQLKFRKYEFVNITTDGLLTLRLVPPMGKREIVKTVETACREGFFIKGENQQSNINNYQWQIEPEAVNAVSRWRWVSKPVLSDSWGWVHGVQLFIGLDLSSRLAILCLTTYHNFRSGHRWVGDAYVGISSTQLISSGAVLVSWYMNEFWSIREFCLGTAFEFSEVQNLKVYDAPARADLLTLYLGACSLLGLALRERIDPLVAITSFLLGYDFRVPLLAASSTATQDAIIEYSDAIYQYNVQPPVPGQDMISPMRFWSTHPLARPRLSFLLQCLSPIFVSLACVVGYVIVRKLVRRFCSVSQQIESELTPKQAMTQFEIATGAKLENRFGVLADFETSVVVQGAKFASPDGIYSTGFVVANNKFLLQTSDYWSIVLIKILGRRFRNVYVYDVDGTTVKQTARLVYPSTLSVTDLVSIDVSPLS